MALMRVFSSQRQAMLIGIGAALWLAGCAYQPAFRAELPATVESTGRTLAIIGDLQQTSWFVRFVRHREGTAAVQQQLVADLRQHISELGALIIVGDLVYTARSTLDWRHFDDLVTPFAEAMPVLPAIGNHDYPCFLVQFCRPSVMPSGMSERFPWMQAGAPYAVDSGELLLLFLDSESHIREQGEWLREQLNSAAARYSAALIFFHRPAWTNSIDRGAVGNPDIQQFVVPVVRDAPLPVAVFNGHVHGFEHIVRDGVNQITTAGGGGPRGPLADVRPDDVYRGPDCPQPDGNPPLRPFNYLLLQTLPDRLDVEVRGLCGNYDTVRTLDRIRIRL